MTLTFEIDELACQTSTSEVISFRRCCLYTQTDRQTDRQTDTHTHTHRTDYSAWTTKRGR